jgi:hypothetical protein
MLSRRAAFACRILYIGRLLFLLFCVSLVTSCQVHSGAAKSDDEIGFERVVNDAILRKTDLNQLQVHGHLALFIAAKCGYTDVVQTILNNGGDPRIQDGGSTPLHALAGFSNSDVAKASVVASLLIDHGADINARDSLGMTPICSLDVRSVDIYTMQTFRARMVYAIHDEAEGAESHLG